KPICRSSQGCAAPVDDASRIDHAQRVGNYCGWIVLVEEQATVSRCVESPLECPAELLTTKRIRGYEGSPSQIASETHSSTQDDLLQPRSSCAGDQPRWFDRRFAPAWFCIRCNTRLVKLPLT